MRPSFPRKLSAPRCLQLRAHSKRSVTFTILFAIAWLASAAFVAGQAPYQTPRPAATGQLISSGQPVNTTDERSGRGSESSRDAQTPTSLPASQLSPAPILRTTMPPDAWTTPGSTAQANPNGGSSSTYSQDSSQPKPGLANTASHGAPQLASNSAVIRASATEEPKASQQPKERIPLKSAGSDDSLQSSNRSNSTLQTLVSIGSSLLIVIGLFLGLAWFYRKTINTTLGGGIPKQVVQVLGRTPIATRQQLVLIRFGSKLVLVSLVQGDARMISEITDPLEVDQLAGMCESAQSGSISNSFRSILHQGGAA